MFNFGIMERMSFSSESFGEAAKVDFLAARICAITQLIVGAARRDFGGSLYR